MAGTPGVKGSRGSPGDPGKDGPQGPAGPQGQKGEIGEICKFFLFTVRAPVTFINLVNGLLLISRSSPVSRAFAQYLVNYGFKSPHRLGFLYIKRLWNDPLRFSNGLLTKL